MRFREVQGYGVAAGIDANYVKPWLWHSIHCSYFSAQEEAVRLWMRPPEGLNEYSAPYRAWIREQWKKNKRKWHVKIVRVVLKERR